MPKYSSMNPGITPATGVANWVLESIAAAGGRIMEFNWGGEVTVSTAMRTRISRDSAVGVGARTALQVQKLNSNSQANQFFASSTYATTQPTILNAGALFATGWNAHGGVVRWLAAPGEEFVLVGAASIECRQDLGIAQSTFGLVWEED